MELFFFEILTERLCLYQYSFLFIRCQGFCLIHAAFLLTDMLESEGNSLKVFSGVTDGIIIYSVDGYEQTDISKVTEDMLNRHASSMPPSLKSSFWGESVYTFVFAPTLLPSGVK